MGWDRAWTLVPGRVEVRNFRIRGTQKSARWYLEIDSARLSVRILSLLSRRFETEWIEAEGVVFRHVLQPDPGEEHPLPEALPPIPNLQDVPRQDPEPRAPPESRWTLELRGIDVRQIREIWLDAYHFAGEGRARGQCQFVIRGPFQMQQAEIELRGDLSSGNKTVAEKVELTGEARFHPFVFREHKGLDSLRFLDAEARISTSRASIGILDHYFRSAEWLALAGTGRIAAEGVMQRGELLPGTWIEAEDGEFELDYLDFRATGEGRLSGRVEEGAEAPRAVMEARLSTFDLRRQGAKTPHIRGSGFEVRASSPGTDLVNPPTDFEASIDLPTSEIIDLTAYNTYIPDSSGFRFESGKGTLEGHLELSTLTDSGQGHLLLRGKRVAATLSGMRIVGDVTLRSRLTDADPESRRFDLSGSRLELKQVLIEEPGTGEARYWWAHFDLPEGKVRLGHPLELEARLIARLRDSRPFVALVAQRKPLLRWMRPILEVEDLDLRSGFELSRDSVTITGLELTGDGLEILADLEVVGREPSGVVFLRRGPFSASLALEDGESEWKIFGARKWFRRRSDAAFQD